MFIASTPDQIFLSVSNLEINKNILLFTLVAKLQTIATFSSLTTVMSTGTVTKY